MSRITIMPRVVEKLQFKIAEARLFILRRGMPENGFCFPWAIDKQFFYSKNGKKRKNILVKAKNLCAVLEILSLL